MQGRATNQQALKGRRDLAFNVFIMEAKLYRVARQGELAQCRFQPGDVVVATCRSRGWPCTTTGTATSSSCPTTPWQARRRLPAHPQSVPGRGHQHPTSHRQGGLGGRKGCNQLPLEREKSRLKGIRQKTEQGKKAESPPGNRRKTFQISVFQLKKQVPPSPFLSIYILITY